MTRLPNKNPFKNQGLAVFVAIGASFGKRFGKKKSFKTNEMPQMAQIVGLKWQAVDFGKGMRKRGSEK